MISVLQLYLFLLFGPLIIITHASNRTWDVAVIVTNSIETFEQNKTFIDRFLMIDLDFREAAYDEITQTIYTYNVGKKCIYSVNVAQKKFVTFICPTNAYVYGIAFDIFARLLFWVSGPHWRIMKMHLPPERGEVEIPQIVQKLPNSIILSVAIDMCKKHIYWTSRVNRTIERCNYDGSKRKKIIKVNVHPLEVIIDYIEKKLYWIDITDDNHKIERSKLNGRRREVIIHLKPILHPKYLAVDKDTIYWTDLSHNKVWSMPKYPKKNDKPTVFKTYSARVGGIIARNNFRTIDCSVKRNSSKSLSSKRQVPSMTKIFGNVTTMKNIETKTYIWTPDRVWEPDMHSEKNLTEFLKRGFFPDIPEYKIYQEYETTGKNNYTNPEYNEYGEDDE